MDMMRIMNSERQIQRIPLDADSRILNLIYSGFQHPSLFPVPIEDTGRKPQYLSGIRHYYDRQMSLLNQKSLSRQVEKSALIRSVIFLTRLPYKKSHNIQDCHPTMCPIFSKNKFQPIWDSKTRATYPQSLRNGNIWPRYSIETRIIGKCTYTLHDIFLVIF